LERDNHLLPDRTPGKTWNDIQLIQRWDAGQNALMLGERANQSATGRVIPQINEEWSNGVDPRIKPIPRRCQRRVR
jgi:hypothetical protein